VRIRIAIVQRVWKFGHLLWAKVISLVCNHKIFLSLLRPPVAGIQLAPLLPIRWFQSEQMLVLVNMDILVRRILNQLQTSLIVKISIKSSENTKYISINFKYLFVFLRKQCFGMLHVLENEISLWKRSGGTAHLLFLDGTMISSIWILAVLTHFHDSFASFENWVISVTIKDILRNTSNCFRRGKSPDFTVQLVIVS